MQPKKRVGISIHKHYTYLLKKGLLKTIFQTITQTTTRISKGTKSYTFPYAKENPPYILKYIATVCDFTKQNIININIIKMKIARKKEAFF